MTSHFIFEKLGIALLLGMLVGLQREKAQDTIAGVRTFPLITIFGTLCALLAQTYGMGILVGGILSLVALVIVGNVSSFRAGENNRGITTEVSILVMFTVGAFLVVGPVLASIAIGGGVAVLLQFKPELHGFASRLGDSDLKAIMRFVLLSFIILPVLPNEVYGPFEVFNPHEIWLMVVFIVGLNLTGYMISKFVGPAAGILSSGILGGLVSSTATTSTFSRAARKDPNIIPRSATIILIASTFVYLRVIVEVALVSAVLFERVLIPLGAIFIFSLILCVFSYLSSRSIRQENPEPKPTTEVRSALLFGVTYAAVVIATAAVRKYLGVDSLFWVAGISGLTDVDAITLSTARLVARQQLEPTQATRMIILATLSNLAFKTCIVAVVGNPRLLLYLGRVFGVCIIFGAAVLLWL